MLRNAVQSDRRNQGLDDQFGIQKKNVLNSPEVTPIRTLQRGESRNSQLIPSLQKITRNTGSRLSVVSRNDKRKSTINSNMSNKKRDKLLREYQDLFQDESFSSDSRSSSKSRISKQLKAFVDPKNIDKEIDEEMEFIHKTLNQRMSTISKQQKEISVLKGSQKSQLKQTTKSFKSMKQMSQNLHSLAQIKQSTRFRKENSIASSKFVGSSENQEMQSLVKILDRVGVPDQEQAQYTQIIEELEKQCVDLNPNGAPRIKQKVRKTFISLFNQYYGSENPKKNDGDQVSLYSIAQNESVFFGNKAHESQIVKNQSNINVTSIMENVFTKKSNQKPISDKMKRLMDDFQLELNDNYDSIQQSQNSSSEIVEDEEDEQNYEQPQMNNTQTLRDPTSQWDRQIFKYQKKYKRDPIYDPYPLIWESKQDFEWIFNDYKFYWDDYPLSEIRKSIVLVVRIINISLYKIISHHLFTIFVLGSIIFNIVFFVQSQDETLSQDVQDDLRSKKKIILILFIVENVLKLIGLGLFKYIWDLQNLFDLIILVLFILHFNYPDIMVVDFSTARLFRLLTVMSIFSKRLRIMLIAVKHSIKFLLEALLIVIIFSYFFALFGQHLFKGLFQYHCYIAEEGIQTKEECGYNLQCKEHELICAKSLSNPNVPTNFDDIFYSYEQVVRVMIFNEWTEPLYLSMLSFHDFTVIYYILIIFIIGIFGANLIIAVLKIYYSQTLEEYEFEEIKENSENEDTILNLRIIKNYQIDQDLLENKKQITCNKVKDEQQTQIKTNLYGIPPKVLNYKCKFLSARQTREWEEIKNRKRGIKPRTSNIHNLIENFTISNIILSDQNKEQFMQKLYSNEGLEKDYFKLFYIQTFKQYPLHSWRSVVNKNFVFISTSENDIFSVFKQNQQLQRKREREFEFIRKFALRHYYFIKKSEYSFVKQQNHLSETRRGNSETKSLSQRRIKFPIKQKPKKPLTPLQQEFKKNFISQKISLRQKDESPSQCLNPEQVLINDDPNRKSIRKTTTVITKKKNTIKINDEECDYEEVKYRINRQIPDSSKQPLDFEDIYVQFRMEECRQSIIYRHNWSGNEVIYSKNIVQFKKLLFKLLNNQDTNIWLANLRGYLILIQKYAMIILKNKFVKVFFDSVVLTNILLLSLIGYVDEQRIKKINDLFILILIAELLLKLLQCGIIRFCSLTTNIIDTVILTCAFITSVEVMQNLEEENLYLDLLSSFQTFLVYRIIKYNSFAVKIAKITKKSLPSFCNLILLMVTLMFIFAFIGMNLYKNKFPLDTDLGLSQSFDDIQAAFLTVFIRAANDDWIGMMIMGSQYSYEIPTMFYGVISVYVLNLMTIGSILAIILDAFSTFSNHDEDQHKDDQYQVDTEISEDLKILNTNEVTLNSSISSEKEEQQQPLQSEQKEKGLMEDQIVSTKMLQSTKLTRFYYQSKPGEDKKQLFQLVDTINKLVDKLFQDFQFFSNNESQLSLFIFSQENYFRKFCYRFIHYSIYIHFIQMIFFISLINMCFYTYYDDDHEHGNHQYQVISEDIESAVNVILLIDSILKIISLGFTQEKGAFTSEFWRLIDFIYQLCYFANCILHYSAFKYVKILKYTRPFRFLYLFEELKYINSAISKSIVDLINILFVQLMVWLIFAIFGIIIYKDKMGYCEHPLNFGVNKEECIKEGNPWVIHLYNFDNLGNAMLTLFRITACDEWVYICQVCLNSRSEDLGPILYGNRWITFIYFILFILVGVLFFMGFFAGILFINFQTYKLILQKQILTKDQQLFADVTKMILMEVPNYSNPPNTFLRRLASDIVKQPSYERLILLTILFNTAILTFFYDSATIQMQQKLEYIYQLLTCFLIFDTYLKILAFGLRRYWGFSWRRIEFFLSFIALVDLIMYLSYDWTKYYYYYTINEYYFIFVRLAFALRNLRTLLIIQQFRGLTRLLRILNYSASFLFQILCFLISILLFYGYIGCEFFGKVEKGEYINEYMNFSNIGKALIVLFKACTKNNWVRVMIDVSDRNKHCQEHESEECGSSWIFASTYFYTFLLLSSFVAFNLFITALVDQFEKFFHSQNSVLQTYIENIDPFRTVWCKYSSETKGKQMHSKHLANFLLELGPPLGSAIGDNIWDAAKSASNFKIRADQNGYIHFQEVLYETIRFVYRNQIFRTGTPESIEAIKQIDKDVRFRLHYKRIDILDRREHIYDQMHIKGNFNILQEYLFLLMIYRTLRTYAIKTIAKIQNNILSPNSLKKKYFVYDSEEESEYNDTNQQMEGCQHQVSLEQENYEQYIQLEATKYITVRGQRKLKFQDETDDSPNQCPVIYLPQSTHREYSQNQSVRGKSALKKQTQQAFNFVDFEAAEQKNLQNPMLDSSNINENSRSYMTDSLIDFEQQINGFHVITKQKPHRCRFSVSSYEESVGTESHNFYKGKQQKKREGRNYVV
ncbi:unnamed protein product (macronuclear) [Paramecium tetraurelia]|uniref:Ion transport domain-containing protein n=1 Tax=Paramecium tetraurelia TaxID=5888 RepID=A0DX61_PARTE|nr:uncharacterized protein GSPATT00021260001 [Paramecium tetraurelia]CAK87628.1 unnamed protein product [Paramecium tetraurelia]|eukprot:XP_001455025.1 hypothetical protein (macronuclear) [Paramecium tetraurelia strain d4-2]